jgi:uncharacterized membrane protein YgcG
MTDEFDEVLTQLEPLRFTPDRSEAAARLGLQSFLGEAAHLRQTVSAPPRRRLTGWMFKSNQERSPMFALAIKLVLVLAVAFGGAGVTAAAAQNSLPNEALYPVKLLIEEAQSGLASTPDAQIDAQLEQAQQRVREMVQLTDRGAAIPAEVPVRLQTRLQAALQIAAQLDDQSMQAALDRIQLRTQDQLREMERLQLHEPVQALTQAREMAQLGQSDPQLFRARVGAGRPADAPPQPQNTPQSDPAHTPQPSRTPQAAGTPQNHSYGPGPLGTQQPVATPVGQGEGHEYGPGPQATSIPGGTPQGSQDGLGGNGPGTNASPEPGGSDNGGGDNGGGDDGGSDNGGSDNGGGNTGGSGGSGGH